jgi:hypothetical protein
MREKLFRGQSVVIIIIVSTFEEWYASALQSFLSRPSSSTSLWLFLPVSFWTCPKYSYLGLPEAAFPSIFPSIILAEQYSQSVSEGYFYIEYAPAKMD